jgi:hypoxanthine phosphoribosyltransferase
MTEERIVTYNVFGELMELLINLIKKDKNLTILKYVCGIPDGGLGVALHISKHLKLEMIDIQRFEDDARVIPEFVLMVDDLCDTGRTLTYHDSEPWMCISAAIFVKNRSSYRPNHFVQEIDSDIWVRWPWEDPDEIPNRPGYEEILK